VLAPASPPGWKELVAAGFLFTAMAFVVFGWYAFHGGFIADDWVNAGRYYLHSGSGFWDAVGNYQTPSRPVAAFYVTLTYAVLGLHTHQHLVLAVLLAAFLSIAYFTFLRTIGLGTLLALAAAALLLVFPSSDSTRLWSTGSQINLFIGLYLVAVVIAISGRRRFGPEPTRAAVATQVLASVLAVTAVAGYEIVAPAVLLSVFLYRWIDRRGAVWRWLLDAIPTLLLLIFVTSQFRDGGDQGTQLLTNLRLMADGGLSVLSYSLVPSREVSRWLVFGGLAALLAGVLVARRFAARRPDLDAIAPWLASLALAIVAIALGYVMLVPAGADYPPYSPGVQNRANCFAALGICLFVVLLAVALGALLAAAIPRASEATRGRVRIVAAGALILGLLGVYTVRIDESSDRWRKVAEIQPGILASSQELVPSPEPDATIFTSGFPGYSAPGIPIFGGGGNEDEVGAFKVIYDEPEIRAFPLLDQIGLDCGALRVSTPDAPNSPTRYGRAIIVDPLAQRVYRPRTQRQCDEVVEAIPFGPSYLSGAW
jgi:hypothetical protein